jgi:hypothetical protein
MAATGRIGPLPATQLCRRCQPEQFAFETTDQLQDLDGVLGQVRAVGAIEFGVGIRREGYNLFAMGPAGIGRHTIVRRHLEKQAHGLGTPSDWCYVFNFDVPHKPRTLQFPAGQAGAFAQKMERLVEELRAAIAAAFETDEYRTRREEIEREFDEARKRQSRRLEPAKRGRGAAAHAHRLGFAPVRKDKVTAEEWSELPAKELEAT